MRRRPSVSSGSVAALLAVVALASCAVAAFESPWPDARCAGLAAFGPVADLRDAGGRVGPVWSARLSASELFGLEEARGFRAYVERGGDSSVGVELARFGSALYEERTVGLRVSKLVDDGTRAILRVRALGLAASGTDGEWTAAVDAGLSATLLGRMAFECRWDNLGRASIGGSPVSSTGRLSARVESDRLAVVASALLEPGLGSSVSLGLEFDVAAGLALRAGTATRPRLFAAGLGVAVPARPPGAGAFVLDLAWQWHPELGGSSFASLSVFR
ncbi:MAG: hypothetical protein ABIG03_04950 [Candidatus Eisenbacteria bacterium]